MSQKKIFSCELALVIATLLNSFCVSLINKSGFGITTLSSVPLVLSHIYTSLSFGTWNFIFQGATILMLIIVTKHFEIGYFISFGIAIIFGALLDIYGVIMMNWPNTFAFRILYFTVGSLLVTVGAALYIKCMLPALPFDTVIRDLTKYMKSSVKKVKTSFDLICIIITLSLSMFKLGFVDGVGIGTIICALFTGTITNRVLNYLDSKYEYKIKIPLFRKLFMVNCPTK